MRVVNHNYKCICQCMCMYFLYVYLVYTSCQYAYIAMCMCMLIVRLEITLFTMEIVKTSHIQHSKILAFGEQKKKYTPDSSNIY